MLYKLLGRSKNRNMSTTNLSEIQKEIIDLKIRVNNLEKKMSKLQADLKPKSKTCGTTKYI